MRRHELTDQQWEKLKPFLPPQKPEVGKPNEDHRRIINGILWKLKTGAPWRDIPEQYGPWSTVYSRFFRWRNQGIWDRILSALESRGDAQGEVDWDIHFVDGTIIRAHQHAAGAKQSEPEKDALGYSQGGFSTKVHIRTEGSGKLITFVLTPGERHETTAFHELMETGTIKKEGRGRPRLRPKRVAGDKAYSSREIREYLRDHHVGVIIPRRVNETRTGFFDKLQYRLRNRIERFINRIKHFRSIATRYEKTARSYRALWVIAAIFLWL